MFPGPKASKLVFDLLNISDTSWSKIGSPSKKNIRPRKLTWNPKVKVWKIIFLFKGLFFRFHINFLGCTHMSCIVAVILLLLLDTTWGPNVKVFRRSVDKIVVRFFLCHNNDPCCRIILYTFTGFFRQFFYRSCTIHLSIWCKDLHSFSFVKDEKHRLVRS